MSLSFGELQKVNAERCRLWHPGFPHDNNWTLADWSNAMVGEAGECANVIKKLRRAELGTKGAKDPSPVELRSMAGEEIADTIIYADLLATKLGISTWVAVMKKFNAVSRREGYNIFL